MKTRSKEESKQSKLDQVRTSMGQSVYNPKQKEKKDQQVMVRFTKREKELIEHYANDHSSTVAQVIRSGILDIVRGRR